MLAPGRDEVAAEIANLSLRLRDALNDQVQEKKRDLQELAGILQERRPDYLITEARQNLDRKTEDLQEALRQSLQEKKLHLQRFTDFLSRATPLLMVKPFREKLHGLGAQLQAYHPYGPLKRGYAVVSLKKTGEILRSPKGLEKGERLGIQLQQGTLESEVIQLDGEGDGISPNPIP